jgi:hypothetical protein
MISFPFGLLDALLWLFLLLGAIASVVLAILINRRPQQRPLVYAMVGALVATLLLAAVLPITPNAAAGGILSLLMIFLAAAGGGPVVTAVLDIATGGVSGGRHGGILVPASGHTVGDIEAARQPTREILRGGETIGILERLSVAAVIVAGYPEGLGVIIAIKGVGRFSELGEAAEARERFIIGTLVSWLWASTCGGLVLLTR